MASLRGSAKGNWFQAGKVLGLFAEHSEPDLNDVIMMSLVPISNLWRQILCFMPLTTRCLILFMRLRMWFDRALRKPAWQNCLVSFRHSLTMLYFCHTCHHEISMIINQIDTAVRLFVEICKKNPIQHWVKSCNLFFIREEDESTKQYFPVSLGQF